jgi:hypothetical protein
MMKVRVAVEFSRYLGGRYRADGPFSGEAFRDDLLLKLAQQALRSKSELIVDFDGVAGIPTSFLEEAFGGLVRKLGKQMVPDLVKLIRVEAPQTPSLWQFTQLAPQFMREAAREL